MKHSRQCLVMVYQSPLCFLKNTLLGICYGMKHSLACAIYCVREQMFEFYVS